ncbi:MAG: NrfD/PsrC family molybdoenzyme membrane anchor subunit [Pseudomonadota bacterium]|nr:NrfD/PsrC family molybdoenzyme membrane anchor subunit [Pseudomonadota bacterium]
MAKQTTVFTEIKGASGGYYLLLLVLAGFIGAALLAAHYMESHGHYVTGMTNQVVWGMPHVFAIFLIVAASGALNVASVGSVFGKLPYKPLGRLSGLLAIALLIGGLAVLVLDLGRADRLIVAMTKYNFKSIFAWNILLYVGFMLVVAVYLWMMFERRMNKFSSRAGLFAFVWRFVLTTGTGSIFGFLVARQAYDAAIMAPMFVIMSLSFGTAVFILVLMAAYKWSGRPLDDALLERLKRLNGVLVAAVFYMVIVFHVANLYATEHHGVERFLLLDGGIYTFLFWVVQILLGAIAPLVIFFTPAFNSRGWTVIGALLVLVGALAQIYVIIIGAQAYPLVLFPAAEVSSSFFDGQINQYAPTLAETVLGVGGIALALLATAVAVKVLPFLPQSLGTGDSGAKKEQTEA